MKTFYTLLLALILGMTFTSYTYAAQNGGQAGQQNHYSDNTGYSGNGVGDMIQQRDRDQDCDYAGSGDCDGDHDRVQARDRDQDCDGTCDGDQLQTRDRLHQTDPDYTQYQDRAAVMNRMQELMEQLRNALAKMYGWQ